MSVQQAVASVNFARQACVGDLNDTATQCCLCCGDLEVLFPDSGSDSTDYCRIGCLGYLDISCDIIDFPGQENNERNLEFCSFGGSFSEFEEVKINNDLTSLTCTNDGSLNIETVKFNTSSPSASMTEAPSVEDDGTSINLPVGDGLSSDLFIAYFLGGSCLIVVSIILLTVSLVILRKVANLSAKANDKVTVNGNDLAVGTNTENNDGDVSEDIEASNVKTMSTKTFSIDKDI